MGGGAPVGGRKGEKLAGRRPGAQSTLREGGDRGRPCSREAEGVGGGGAARPWKQSPAWHRQRRT